MTITEDIKFLSKTVREIAESINQTYAAERNHPVPLCFWNLYNRIKITEEIITFYENSWHSVDFSEIDKTIKFELIERIITITKDLFVDLVSAIEKAVKDSIGVYTNSDIKKESLRMNSHLYLRNIIECSMRKKVVDESTFEKWDDILTMRNLAVHNNSTSDRNKKYSVGGINISMRPGRMMKGPLNTFVVLSSCIIELFHSWVKKMNEMF